MRNWNRNYLSIDNQEQHLKKKRRSWIQRWNWNKKELWQQQKKKMIVKTHKKSAYYYLHHGCCCCRFRYWISDLVHGTLQKNKKKIFFFSFSWTKNNSQRNCSRQQSVRNVRADVNQRSVHCIKLYISVYRVDGFIFFFLFLITIINNIIFASSFFLCFP